MFEGLLKRSKNEPSYSVLIVGDELSTSTVMVSLLETDGYAVLVAATVAEALALLDEALPDAFVVNFTRPQVDGKRFVESARIRYGRTRLPPILMLTSTPDGELAANAIQVEDCLPGPFDHRRFLDHVHVLVRGRSLASV